MKKVAKIFLKLSAKIAVARNNYKIIAITGSVGKTSTKKAVILVLERKFKVLSSEEGYNTEFGLPLILLQKKVPKSKIKWLFLILVSPVLALKKKDFDYCVLEMGADKPGDIDYLINIAKPNIAIVTNVSESHLVDFANILEIANEKEKILSKLRNGEIAILNIDNESTSKMKTPSGAKKLTFGKKSSDIQIIAQELKGTESLNKFHIKDSDIIIKSNAIGEHVLYAFAPAILVGVSQGIEPEDIRKSLETFKPVKGRLNIIEGVNGSIIIDDSYNANPASMKNALDVLGRVDSRLQGNVVSRKIAALGSMNELGKYSQKAHEEIGRYLVGKCDILVTVGDEAKKHMAKAAHDAGMKKDNIFSYATSAEAGDFLQGMIKKDDIVLAKGSQNKIRMEKAVIKIMANPADASKLLCRQGEEWEKR